jgi:hypothetical protein
VYEYTRTAASSPRILFIWLVAIHRYSDTNLLVLDQGTDDHCAFATARQVAAAAAEHSGCPRREARTVALAAAPVPQASCPYPTRADGAARTDDGARTMGERAAPRAAPETAAFSVAAPARRLTDHPAVAAPSTHGDFGAVVTAPLQSAILGAPPADCTLAMPRENVNPGASPTQHTLAVRFADTNQKGYTVSSPLELDAPVVVTPAAIAPAVIAAPVRMLARGRFCLKPRGAMLSELGRLAYERNTAGATAASTSDAVHGAAGGTVRDDAAMGDGAPTLTSDAVAAVLPEAPTGGAAALPATDAAVPTGDVAALPAFDKDVVPGLPASLAAFAPSTGSAPPTAARFAAAGTAADMPAKRGRSRSDNAIASVQGWPVCEDAPQDGLDSPRVNHPDEPDQGDAGHGAFKKYRANNAVKKSNTLYIL